MGNYMPTIFWIVAMIAFIVIEAATPQLVSIWFAAGALAAVLCSLVTNSIAMQALVFFLVAAVCLLVTRPMASKVTEVRKCPTNADMVIGQLGKVTEQIDPITGKGRVIVMGGTWAAFSGPDTHIAEGETVLVEKISGVKLLVTPIAEKE